MTNTREEIKLVSKGQLLAFLEDDVMLVNIYLNKTNFI